MDFDHSWHALLKPGDGPRFFALRPLPVFAPHLTAFYAPNAWWLAEMSRLIYRSETETDLPGFPTREAILADMSIHEIVFAGSHNVQWSLNRVEGVRPFAVLVFRGSSGFENWLANLKVFQSPWERGGQVHTGFKAIFMQIREEIEAALGKVTEPVFYTGHSLGGALAVLAASVWPPRATYTFGAPRVGDMLFRESLSGQCIYRITNERDIVASVPPSRIPFEFCHVGQPFQFQSPEESLPGKELLTGRSLTETGSIATATGSAALFSYPPRFLSEHAPINYSAGLARHLQEARASDMGRLLRERNDCDIPAAK